MNDRRNTVFRGSLRIGDGSPSSVHLVRASVPCEATVRRITQVSGSLVRKGRREEGYGSTDGMHNFQS